MPTRAGSGGFFSEFFRLRLTLLFKIMFLLNAFQASDTKWRGGVKSIPEEAGSMNFFLGEELIFCQKGEGWGLDHLMCLNPESCIDFILQLSMNH